MPDASCVFSASALAIECGADFIKTSTGMIATGATQASVAAMLEAIGEKSCGIKISGG